MDKPLYTDEYVAFSPFDQLALAALIRQVAKAGCRAVEIGSWLGNGSTQVFLRMFNGVPDASVLCVDTWQGNPNVQRHQDIVERYDVFGTFRANIEKAKSPVKLNALVASSTDAAALLADGSFDLVFIDADHGYDAVRADVAAWRSKVRRGGILCGHDCEARVTPLLRDRLLANRHKDTISGEGTVFPIIHPGSILAVDEAFQGAARLWSEQRLSLPNGTSGCSSIWYVQMPS